MQAWGWGHLRTCTTLRAGLRFSSHLTREAQVRHGAPGRALIEWACSQASTLPKRLRASVQALARACASMAIRPGGNGSRLVCPSGRGGRAGDRGAGLRAGLQARAMQGARACFDAWMTARGGAGNGEVRQHAAPGAPSLEAHGLAGSVGIVTDDHAQHAAARRVPPHGGQRGVLKIVKASAVSGGSSDDKSIYQVLTQLMAKDTLSNTSSCSRCSALRCARAWTIRPWPRSRHGALLPSAGRAFDCKQRLPGLGLSNCYRIPPALFALDT